MKVSTTTAVFALAAVAHGAAHLQPYDKRQPQPKVAERDLQQRDLWSDIEKWWNELLNDFRGGHNPPSGGYGPPPSYGGSTTASSIQASTSTIDTSTPTFSLPSISDVSSTSIGAPGASTGIVTGSPPVSSATGTASVGTSVKPVSSSSAGTSNVETSVPATSSAAGTGSVGTSVKPASSSSTPESAASGSGPSSAKPTSSATSSVNTNNNNASGSSASACTKKTSKSRSGAGGSGTGAATTSKSASGTGVGSSVKPVSSATSSVNTKNNNGGSSASACTKKTSKSRSGSAGSGTGAATSSKSASGTGVGSSVKPVSSATSSVNTKNNNGSGSSASACTKKPSKSQSGPAGSGTGAATSSKSPSGTGSGPSSVKPVSSATSSVNTNNNNGSGTGAASGSSASACTKKPSKSRSGTGASATAPTTSKSASGSASGTGIKTTKRASGSASSGAPTQTASPSLTTPNSAQSSGTGPTASCPAGTIVGQEWNGVDQFIGIPYAQPPVGPLRLKPPVALNSSLGVYQATTPPASCPQMAMKLTGNYSAGALEPIFDKFIFAPTNQSEDCLTINVFRPNGTAADAKLPVLYWIFGGGFQFGASSMYNGTDTVRKSVQLGAPIILVAVNYRVGGFGFLHGADLAAEHSTNLGLRDQWLGLQWVSDNIDSFGGDSTKVTIWGESAGAISAAYLTTVYGGQNEYNGKRLFRASIHNSGSIAPADNGTAKQAQTIYDTVVDRSGCSASTADARLACLRSVDFATLQNATNSIPGFGTYRSADLPYLPRTDDFDPFYNWSTEYAVAAGRWTKTPLIIGDQEDEGTLLAIVQNNITTNDQLVDYIASWFPNDPNAIADVQGLAALYPDNVTAGQPDGSPFHTGSANNLYPQYKRLAAILGDIVFTITRRAFLALTTGQGVKGYSYLATYLQGLADFGTLHGSDLAYLWDPGFAGAGPTNTIQTHYISFVNYLDPNMINSTDIGPAWPLWNASNGAVPDILYFGAGGTTVGNDTFRNDVYTYLFGKVTVFRV